MFSTLGVVLPVFAMIFAGWLARRIGALGPNATSELNRFVVYLALPALLFDIVAHAAWRELWQPGFVAAFGLGTAVIFAATVVLRWRRPRPLVDAVLDALNAGYPNTGFLGFPLALVALGRDAIAPTLVATIMTVCVLFAVAIVMIEIGVQTERRPGRLAVRVGGSLLRNPLLAAPALGAAINLAGWPIPAPAETFFKLLGGAASPCALVALGLFLAAERAPAERKLRVAALLVSLKLIAQPVVTWALASLVFSLAPLPAHAAVLLAALPTGTGPFMLAEFYGREASVTSDVVLASTVISVATISGYLAMVGLTPGFA